MTTSNPIAAIVAKNSALEVTIKEVFARKQEEDSEGFASAVKDCSSLEDFLCKSLNFASNEIFEVSKESFVEFEDIIKPYVSGKVMDFETAMEIICSTAVMAQEQGLEVWDNFTESQKEDWADANTAMFAKCMASPKDYVDATVHMFKVLKEHSEKVVN